MAHDPKEWKIDKNGARKLGEAQAVDIIRTRYKTTHRAAAEKHGIAISTVRHIRAGRRWKTVWERENRSLDAEALSLI